MLHRFLCVLLTLLFALCSAPGIAETINPAAYLATDEQRATLDTLVDMDEGRLYRIDYTADYKLDEMLQCDAYIARDLFDYFLQTLLPQATASIQPAPYGCSSFAALSDDRCRLAGRNQDCDMKMCALMIRTSPKDGYRSIGMVNLGWALYDVGAPTDGQTDLSALLVSPYLVMDGMNEKGLSVMVMSVGNRPTRQDTGKQKITTTVAIRLLLDRAANVNEAIALLKQYDMQSTSDTEAEHYLIADATGRAAVIEYCDGAMEVLNSRRFLTNYFISETMHGEGSGQDRYAILQSAMSYKGQHMTRGEAMTLLSLVSQDGVFRSICPTQWSSLYDLTNLRVQVAIRRNYDKLFSFELNGSDW